MPIAQKRPDLKLTFAGTEYTHIYTYKCECGREVIYYDYEKPERLQKCFECLEKAR